MATKYANFDLATGNNDGSDWTNAWKTMADVIAGSNSAAPSPGDTVYCKGTDTLAGTATWTLSGTAGGGFIRLIGVNAAGTNDGTRAVLDANGGAFSCLTIPGNVYLCLFENFRFTGSGNAHGVHCSNGTNYGNTFVNCSFDTNSQYGIYAGAGFGITKFYRCTFYGNASGILNAATCYFFFCSFHDNTNYGISTMSAGSYAFGSIFYDQAYGIYDCLDYTHVVNCVLDGNTTAGFHVRNNVGFYITLDGNRITNNGVGAKFTSQAVTCAWNAFDGNTDHRENGTLVLDITNNGTATNSELNENGAGGGDTLQGYVSVTDGAEDYSTNYVGATDPHIRRTAITIPTS